MKRLIIVANRLPVTVKSNKSGIEYSPSGGGLATGMASLQGKYEKHWLGWPGMYPKNDQIRKEINQKLEKDNIHPVFLSEKEILLYYEGFSNKTIWPLFHYFTEFAVYDQKFWEVYQKVNLKFFNKIKSIIEPDDIIWVQDYHLMLLPALLKKEFPNIRIGFFLHIPFPSYELFRTLPWREEILDGLMSSDLIGFHTYEYMRHFLVAVHNIKNLEPRLGEFFYKNHLSYVDAFPMGIDYIKYNKAVKSKKVQQKIKLFKENYGSKKLILSVDRLDYSKGILQRLKAFDELLTQYPQYKEQISLMIVVVPSRSEVDKYSTLKVEIDEAVGYINGKYASMEWNPVHYFYRNFLFNELIALYHICDIALITPFRDGMNLVAKEFLATKTEGQGVLILSEMAGAAIVLKNALMINPNDINDIVKAIVKALNMPIIEQKKRLDQMQKQLQENTVQKWASSYIEELERIHRYKKSMESKEFTQEKQACFINAFKKAGKKLLFLNHDNSIFPFIDNADYDFLDNEFFRLIKELSELEGLTIVVMSNMNHVNLNKWYGLLKVDIIAEYGTWVRENNQWNQSQILREEWKEEIYPVLNEFMIKTPGSFIEEKPYALAWHFHSSDTFLADMRLKDMINSLIYPCTKHKLEIIDGNKKIEIKPVGVDKKSVTRHWLNKQNWDLILAIGNDRNDEDVFEILPDEAFSLRVGIMKTNAKFTLKTPDEVITFLNNLKNKSKMDKKKKSFLVGSIDTP
ncbi:MAG: bifunctional alpha,alpha-trehalose-phosphate synthase (UDP-forming)/trehalose-phosphatase [Bacteroidetes bacterium]|nr:bifunctional alpha,alpha-trehalose-phosphate synthase (UDP-forming)/trehalose-phosphatase [Bacteroidota bacterium]HET6242980.1 bifunctional alpha,alpha-trehalose-phosphate synthase (UDP-forming)/trehalose-phosphatase [Bacteroidia bacterium]